MDAQLVAVGRAPLGMLSSALLHGQQEEASPSVLVGLCPTRKLLAFVSGYRAQCVVSTGGEYRTSFEGILHALREPGTQRPLAMAVLVVPVEVLKDGSPVIASMVVVGFSDGCVRVYSKLGTPLVSQQIHTEAVTQLTTMASLSGNQACQYDIVVLCKTCVCLVEGESLAAAARGDPREQGASLSYKKWHLLDQLSTRDLALLSLSTPSTFDYLCEASSVGGVEAAVHSGPSSEVRLIAVGEQPMIALYRITKDGGVLHVSQMVSAVASKMTSVVLGKISQAGGRWLGWGGGESSTPPKQQREEKLQPATNLPLGSSIPDDRRTVYSLSLSPMEDLAAAVDCFGRILLLDTQQLLVRRMWKGYRDAECGWLLVPEAAGDRKAQCLVIYAPYYGIVELWPVQCRKRVAAFLVGKGCRLLYSPSPCGAREGGATGTTVLLCADGQMVTFAVPFSELIIVDDPFSQDAHLLHRLPQALREGATDLILQIISQFRNTRALRKAVVALLRAHPLNNVPSGFTVKVLNLFLVRLSGDTPAHLSLREYVQGVREVCQLLLQVEAIVPESRAAIAKKLPEMLVSQCGVPQAQAGSLAECLKRYFEPLHPKKVARTMSLREAIECFDLPTKSAASPLLPVGKSVPKESESRRPLLLHEALTEPSRVDLGCTLFLPLLNCSVSDHDLRAVFSQSNIPSSSLMALLCHAVVSGRCQEKNVCVLLQRVHTLLSVIAGGALSEEEREAVWSAFGAICTHTSQTGHALLALLTLPQVVPYEGGVGEEGWESVSVECEWWVRVMAEMEVLTLLAALEDSAPSPPPLPFSEDEDVSAGEIEIHLAHQVVEEGMSVKLLEWAGPELIAASIACWLAVRQISPELVASMPSDPFKVANEAHRRVVHQLAPLLQMLPHSLSPSHLLLHCSWQAACLWRDSPQTNNEMGNYMLRCISQISSPQQLIGAVLFVWTNLLEHSVVQVLDDLKRGRPASPGTLLLAGICRNLFVYLHQLSGVEEVDEVTTTSDRLLILQLEGRKMLTELVQLYRLPPPVIVKTYLELLLATELALCRGTPVNVTTLFPTWLRSAMKKGLVRVSGKQEQVPVQLQHRRSKFLCESVGHYLELPPALVPATVSTAVTGGSATPPLEVGEVSECVFLLARLWELEGDAVRLHWASNLFAAAKVDRGREVFLGLTDKSQGSQELLLLAGAMADRLIGEIENKAERLSLHAQTAPSLLEWMRKQGSSRTLRRYHKLEPTWQSLSQLLVMCRTYLSSGEASATAAGLEKIVDLRTRNRT